MKPTILSTGAFSTRSGICWIRGAKATWCTATKTISVRIINHTHYPPPQTDQNEVISWDTRLQDFCDTKHFHPIQVIGQLGDETASLAVPYTHSTAFAQTGYAPSLIGADTTQGLTRQLGNFSFTRV